MSYTNFIVHCGFIIQNYPLPNLMLKQISCQLWKFLGFYVPGHVGDNRLDNENNFNIGNVPKDLARLNLKNFMPISCDSKE